MRNVSGSPYPTKWHPRITHFGRVARYLGVSRNLDDTWTDRVHPDAAPRQLDRQRPCKCNDRALCGRIRGIVRSPCNGMHRGDVDDAARPVPRHVRNGVLCAEKVALHVEVERLAIRRLIGIQNASGMRYASVVYQDIKPSWRLRCLTDDPGTLVRFAEISLNDPCLSAVSLDRLDGIPGASLTLAVVHNDGCALTCKFNS